MRENPDFPVPEFPRKRQGLVREELQESDDVIFIDNASGSNFAMNRMAAIILELCDGAHTPEAIASIISESVPKSDPEQVASDTAAILSEFSAYGLIDGDG
ncbi:MAG TPA: PqqD family protein [Mariprofundaceae bacterium]|nr:PqqD family protein [Mariprofundaceae bacterium]